MAVVALLGAGIFAQHLPALESTRGTTVAAIYSRSKESVEALAAKSRGSPDIYYDKPVVAGRSLDDLLARSDITAVVVCLPILAQPAVIERAFQSGKHILSEKPIAQDVAVAQSLVAQYGRRPQTAQSQQWAVGENLRFYPSIQHGAEAIKAIGGTITTFSLSMFTFVADSDKYFNTAWRKTPEFQGGFLIDGGVHHIASLRSLLSALGEDVESVVAATALLQPKLAPLDTVHALATTTGGHAGTIGISFGTEFKAAFEIEVVTTQGAVVVTDTTVTSRTRSRDGKEVVEGKQVFDATSGVQAEVVAFIEGLRTGVPDPRQAPEQALRDLAVIEALLESAGKGSLIVNLLK